MVERADKRITRTSGMNTWRAGCGGSRTSGSEGGPEKPTHREMDRALRSDPYTYVSTWQGWLYVAFILDVHSRLIVGWQLANHLRTDLVLDALEMALWRRDLTYGDLIHHSDRGSQYVSFRYSDRLAEENVSASVGSRGDSYDCDDAGVGVPVGLTLAMTDRGVLALTCRPAGTPTSVAC